MDGDSENKFDYDIIAISEELRIRPQILHKLLESFSQTLKNKIVELDQVVPKRSIEEIRLIMHEIKGTSGNLRLKAIYRTADMMHMAVKAEEEQAKILSYFDEFKKQAHFFIQRYQGQTKGE